MEFRLQVRKGAFEKRVGHEGRMTSDDKRRLKKSC